MSVMRPAAYARYRVIIAEFSSLPLEQRMLIAEAAAESRVRELRAMVLGFTLRRSP